MPLHSLTNFETQKYYYSRNNLPKNKGWAYVINLDEYKKMTGKHRIVLYMNGDNVTCFDSFGVEKTPKEIKKFIENKNITTDICRM